VRAAPERSGAARTQNEPVAEPDPETDTQPRRATHASGAPRGSRRRQSAPAQSAGAEHTRPDDPSPGEAEPASSEPGSVEPPPAPPSAGAELPSPDEAARDPVVRAVLEIFDAEVSRVYPRPKDA